jgi:putative oxidoreductase
VLPGSTGTGFDSEFGDDFVETEKPPIEWHGGLDFGLLVLRLVLGGLILTHGLDQLFNWFNGAGGDGGAIGGIGGRGGTEAMLTDYGFSEPAILAWVLAISQIAGGALLIVGLFTPVGAAAVLGVMVDAIVVKGDWNLFLGGVELEMLFAGAAFALLFTGPGRIAIDRNTHWFRRAPAYGFVFLLIAGGASAVTLLGFR